MSGRRIIYTAGVFDLLHIGHIEQLVESKRLGDELIVGVITDAGCEAYKGHRPAESYDERFVKVKALACVDRVFRQDGTDPSSNLWFLAANGLKPYAMTHGDDWTELLEGNETLRALDIAFITIPRTTGVSTTNLLERIRAEPTTC